MESIWQDLRYGARMLANNPGFTLIAILTLALGIGANTAVFSVVNALLLRPLPFREPDRLVWIASGAGKLSSGLSAAEGNLSAVTTQVGNFSDWRSLNASFEDLAAYFAFFDYGSYTLTGSGEPERLRGVGVSQNFLDLLGVNPEIGRKFEDDECVWNGKEAALLSHSFWTSHFGSDPGIVGRSITLNNKATTIVGVLPASFDFGSVFSPGSRIDLLLPFPICEQTNRWGNTLAVVGRLKPGVTLQGAQAEFDVIAPQVQQQHPERNRNGAVLSSLQERISGRLRPAFVVLFCAVGCVLLIACTNLSNLLLARATSRRKEIAIRVALGADRSRLVRQMLTESLLLAGCGAALGLPLAFAATRTLAATRAISIPMLQTVSIDGTALVFTLFAALATGLLFGIAPALQVSRWDVHESLKEASRGSSEGGRSAFIRGALVVSEVALACVLLIGAGLLIRSFIRLLEVDPGFRPEQTASWRIEPGDKYQTQAQRDALYDHIVRSVEAIPGVESAGLTDALPLGRNRSWGVAAKGQTYTPETYPVAFPRLIDPGYIRTMKIPLRDGREFNEHDTADTQKVLVVNETMARLLWPDRDPLGQIALNGRQEWQVVGVVGDVRHGALEQRASPEMYFPMAQNRDWNSMDLVVRAKLPIESLVPGVRATLRSVDPELPNSDFQTLGQLVDQAVSPRRFVTVLLGGFSFLALILASLGIYGVISYSVSQRTNEIGIRIALGAQTRAVLKLILGQGVKLASIGLGIGLAAAFALTRVMSSLLFGVQATDPLTFAGIGLLLTGVALLACYIPARRATRVDPMVALRDE
ncbi:MAG: multidrug ABC transporter substrate-binding protein [Acidobacteria bacterium]|nr:MAG: multidrug ABC transporter substrate-binding protein [Acidobacteriota bacterium]